MIAPHRHHDSHFRLPVFVREVSCPIRRYSDTILPCGCHDFLPHVVRYDSPIRCYGLTQINRRHGALPNSLHNPKYVSVATSAPTISPINIGDSSIIVSSFPSASVAQLVEAAGLGPARCGFESCLTHHVCPCSPIGRDGGLKDRAMLVRVQPRARARSKRQSGRDLKSWCLEVRILPRAPDTNPASAGSPAAGVFAPTSEGIGRTHSRGAA